MRNILEYPITVEECVDTLEREKQILLHSELVGDMRPLIFGYIQEFISQNETKFREFLQKLP